MCGWFQGNKATHPISSHASDAVAWGQDLMAQPSNIAGWLGFSADGLITVFIASQWGVGASTTVLPWQKHQGIPIRNAKEGLGSPTGEVTASVVLCRRSESSWPTSSGKGFPDFVSQTSLPRIPTVLVELVFVMDTGDTELSETWSYDQSDSRVDCGKTCSMEARGQAPNSLGQQW